MKEGWEIKKLGEICVIERGGSPRPINSYLTDSPDGINWVKIGDTQGITKYIYQTKEKIKPEGAKRSRIVNEGDFILSNSMSFGRPFIMKTTGCIHDGWLVLREIVSNINQDYLYYILGSDLIYNQFDNLAAGSTVRNLNIDLVKRVQIPLPPFIEQQRIVVFLDQAFAAIAKAKENAEKNLRNVREVFESYLNSVFANPGKDWERKVLREVGITQTGTTPSTSNKENFGNYVPFIKPADISDDGYVNYSNEGLSELGVNVGRLMKKNSILMVCIGGSIGKVGYIMRDVSCNQQINSLTVNPNYCPKFFYYALICKSFFNSVLNNAAQATLPILNKSKWESLSISFPKSFDKQEKIVYKLDELSAEIKKLEIIYRQKLVDVEELKKSILQKAFNGELIIDN